MASINEELEEYAKLEANWDGDGALAIPAQTIANALWLAERLVPEGADSYPENYGTVSFTWDEHHLEVGLTNFAMYSTDYYINGTIERKDKKAD